MRYFSQLLTDPGIFKVQCLSEFLHAAVEVGEYLFFLVHSLSVHTL